MKVNRAKRIPKNKTPKNEGGIHKRQKREEEKEVVASNPRKPSPSVKLFQRGDKNKKEIHENNSLITPLMNKEASKELKTPIEDPQLEGDTIGVRWRNKEHQIRLESKLLLDCIWENEHHVECRKKNHKALKKKDSIIKELSSKVSQLERVINKATECIADINARYEEKEQESKQREAEEATLKAPSPLTLLFEEQVRKIESHVGEGVSNESDLFIQFKEKHLKEAIKKAHVERLKMKGLEYVPLPPPEPKIDPQTWEVKPSMRQKKMKNAKNRAFILREKEKRKENQKWEKERALSLLQERFIDEALEGPVRAVKATYISDFKIQD